jgi:peptidoglycan-associated lipoprotein
LCFTAAVGLSGCHKKVAAVPPPPAALPAPPPAQPTATLTASPNVIQQGQSTTLTWTTTDATSESITGIGTVAGSSSQTVSPRDSTTYTLTAKGPGGTVQASAEVTVNRVTAGAAPPPSMTEDELFAQNVKDIYFDYDRYNILPSDGSTVDQDAAFLKQYPSMNIVIGGHCDDRGSEEYNLALGVNRAESMKRALIADGIPASRIKTISYGKEKPFCTEEDESCWHKNRVDHVERAH